MKETSESRITESKDGSDSLDHNVVSKQTVETLKALKSKDGANSEKIDEAVNSMLELLVKCDDNPYLQACTEKLSIGVPKTDES